MKERDGMETLFKKMANEYMDAYGESLRKEMEGFTPRITSGMDAKVKAMRGREKHARYTRVLGVVAACLAVLVIIPVVYNQSMKQTPMETQADYAMEAPAAAEDTMAEEAVLPNEPQATAAPEAAADAATAGEADEAPAAGTAEGGEEHKLIPLTAELPENFSISAVEQDKGKTIYYLDNTELDPAVVTLERNVPVPDTAGYREIDIDGQPAYGSYQPDYSILVFEKDGVLYELTCEHDLNTLVDLGKAIL